jgi:hypothetical protein
VEGEEESDLIDESVESVDQLFEIIAQDELLKLKPELEEEEYDQVQNIRKKSNSKKMI